jgi:hypothetical protein
MVGIAHPTTLRYDGTSGAFESVFAEGGGLSGPSFLAFSPAAVPEPSSLVSGGIGLIVVGLALYRRRRAATA